MSKSPDRLSLRIGKLLEGRAEGLPSTFLLTMLALAAMLLAFLSVGRIGNNLYLALVGQ